MARTISKVFDGNLTTWYTVGYADVVAIEQYEEYGQMAHVPMIRVHRSGGNEIEFAKATATVFWDQK